MDIRKRIMKRIWDGFGIDQKEKVWNYALYGSKKYTLYHSEKNREKDYSI